MVSCPSNRILKKDDENVHRFGGFLIEIEIDFNGGCDDNHLRLIDHDFESDFILV